MKTFRFFFIWSLLLQSTIAAERTTPYTRELLKSEDAASARSILGVSAGAGSVLNSGASTTSAIPIYSNTTGTNITPSKVTISALTNLQTGGLIASNLTASRVVFSDSGSGLVSSGTSAGLIASLSDPTGSGSSVFNTAPTLSLPYISDNISFATNIITGTSPSFSATNKLTRLVMTGNTTATITDVGSTGTQTFVLEVVGNGSYTLAFSGVTITAGFGTFANPPANGTTVLSFRQEGATLYRDVLAAMTIQDIYDVGGISAASTNTFTQKTFDTAGTGNNFKTIKYADFLTPAYGDGAGAVPQTNNYTASGFGHYTFSGTAATNVNFVRYEWAVPDELDTSGSVKITRFKFSTAGTSTSQINFHVAYGEVAVSAGRTPTLSGHVLFNVTPSSVTANDLFEATAITICNASALTAGRKLVIEIARDGTDSNNDAITEDFLRLEYPSTK